ncbi:ATP/GTP-binding protein [candidate division KSB1 bacterium]
MVAKTDNTNYIGNTTKIKGSTMLLQFSVENFLSFNKETTLNMIPTKRKKHRDHILEDKQGKKIQSLPIAAIYGANASGKSNLVKAFKFSKDLIINGTRGNESIDTIAFKLDSKCDKKPSRFEYIFKIKGVIYTYGFAVTQKHVEEEWLFANFTNREVMLFERTTRNGKAVIEFGNKLAEKGRDRSILDFIKETTRPNQLFLTESYEKNIEKLKAIYEWFYYNLIIIFPDAKYRKLRIDAYTNLKFIENLKEFLRKADTGIQMIKLDTEKLKLESIFADMPGEMIKNIKDDLSNVPTEKPISFYVNGKLYSVIKDKDGEAHLISSLSFFHKDNEGNHIKFKTEEESDGTQRLMHLYPALLHLQEDENTYIIDEIDRSMHPLLCKFFIEIFLKTSLAKKSRGQLIVTSHQTCLFDGDLLRSDELWLVEKDENGSSSLSSLVEYRIRNDLRIDKSYLNGRFGAIPVIEPFFNMDN